MIEEIVKGVTGFTGVYSLVNIYSYLSSVAESMRRYQNFEFMDHLKIGTETFKYNFSNIQLIATAYASPPLLYNLYQLIQK